MGTANTHTHLHTLTRACTSTHPPTTHPPTHTHTQVFGEKEGGKGGFERHTFYKTRDYNVNRK